MDDLEARDLFAMFAMCGALAGGELCSEQALAEYAYKQADAMLEARKPLPAGLPEVMKKRTRK